MQNLFEKDNELHGIPFPVILDGLKGVNASRRNLNISDFNVYVYVYV